MYQASTRRAITSISTLKSQSKPSHFDVKKTKRFNSKLLQLAAAPKQKDISRREEGKESKERAN
jgi:hypothetical protein